MINYRQYRKRDLKVCISLFTYLFSLVNFSDGMSTLIPAVAPPDLPQQFHFENGDEFLVSPAEPRSDFPKSIRWATNDEHYPPPLSSPVVFKNLDALELDRINYFLEPEYINYRGDPGVSFLGRSEFDENNDNQNSDFDYQNDGYEHDDEYLYSRKGNKKAYKKANKHENHGWGWEEFNYNTYDPYQQSQGHHGHGHGYGKKKYYFSHPLDKYEYSNPEYSKILSWKYETLRDKLNADIITYTFG